MTGTKITGSITAIPGYIDGWEVRKVPLFSGPDGIRNMVSPQVDNQPEPKMIDENLPYPSKILGTDSGGEIYVVDSEGFPGWKRHKEAVRGCAMTVDGNEPIVLATDIEYGCIVVWFARSSAGNTDGRIGGVTASNGVEIIMPDSKWEMKLQGECLTIFRTVGTDTLEISVMVVKL